MTWVIIGGLTLLTLGVGALNIYSYVTRDPNDPYWSEEAMKKRHAIASGAAACGYAAMMGYGGGFGGAGR